MNTSSRETLQLKLSDGRVLGYEEFGRPHGKPVVLMHGFSSSRLDWLMFDPENGAAQQNMRIIAPDRPGIGLSDFKRGRALLDWPDDVAELADALQLSEFAVLGISGGGPYAAACAYKMPERVTGTSIISGMGPSQAPGAKDGESWTLPGKPALVRRLILIMMRQALNKQPDRLEAQLLESVSKPDRQLLNDHPEVLQTIINSMHEALRQGTGGLNHDATIYTRPWGFQLQDIATDVQLWHGEQDNNVAVSVGRYVAGAIPNCQATFLENEGHFSLAYHHMPKILSDLAG